MKKFETLLNQSDVDFLKRLHIQTPKRSTLELWRLTDDSGRPLYENADLEAVLWAAEINFDLDCNEQIRFRFLRVDRCPTESELRLVKRFYGKIPNLVFFPAATHPPNGTLVIELYAD